MTDHQLRSIIREAYSYNLEHRTSTLDIAPLIDYATQHIMALHDKQRKAHLKAMQEYHRAVMHDVDFSLRGGLSRPQIEDKLERAFKEAIRKDFNGNNN